MDDQDDVVEKVDNENPRIDCTTNEKGDDKVCRICLEDDYPEIMIAPCNCKGSSKWVHRECLDLWRTNERDRAFSQCTECLFKYHLQPTKAALRKESQAKRRRLFRFYYLVSQDICFVHLILQLIVASLALFIYLIDRRTDDEKEASLGYWFANCENSKSDENTDRALAEDDCSRTTGQLIGNYYLFGLVLFFVLIGVCGCFKWMTHGCSVSNSIPSFDSHAGSTTSRQVYGNLQRAEVYRTRRVYTQEYRQSHYGCCYGCYCDPSICFWPCFIPSQARSGGGEGCCNGCCDFGAGGDGCGGTGDGGCCGAEGDCAMVCLMLLAFTAVIMAMVGFVLGLVIAVATCQTIVRRHIFILHKKQLAKDFQVMDLSCVTENDLEMMATQRPQALSNGQSNNTSDKDNTMTKNTADTEEMNNSSTQPSLPYHDSIYLQGLGLM